MRVVQLIGVAGALAIALDLAVGARALPDPSRPVAGPWAPAALAGGAALGAPRVAFNSTGNGTIAWDASAGGARELALTSAARSGAARGAARTLRATGALPLALDSVATATTDGHGRVVLAGDLATGTGATAATLEADPAGPFGAPRALGRGGGPLALANYLTGEVALATAGPAGRSTQVVLRTQPPRAAALGPPAVLSARRGAVTAIAVGLDWRGDALVAWQQDGLIYARERSTTGGLGPLQAVGVSAGDPRLDAVISDDGRAIVAWTDETSPTAGEPRTARTRLAISGPRVRFAGASIVTAWSEPAGLRLGPGAMRLLRLGNGRVVLGWTDRQAGSLVARVAPVTLAGLHPAVTVSPAGADAQLTDLAPGGRGEVLGVFAATRPGAASGAVGEIEAAVGVDDGAGQAVFSAAQPVASGSAAGDPTAAYDPVGDHPVIAWLAPGGAGGARVRYAIGATEPLPR